MSATSPVPAAPLATFLVTRADSGSMDLEVRTPQDWPHTTENPWPLEYKLTVKWDGCIHLWKYGSDEEDPDYIHLCSGGNDLIRLLAAVQAAAKAQFQESHTYWAGGFK